MNQNHRRSMVVHFKDGSKKVIRFPAPVPDGDANLAARLKEALEARHIVLEADGALIVIPTDSIQYLQCVPAPDKLPFHAIRGATFTD